MNSINKIHGTVIHDARISDADAESIKKTQLEFGFNCAIDAAGTTYTLSDIDNIPAEIIAVIKQNVNKIVYTDDNYPVFIQEDAAGIITIRDLGAYTQQLNSSFLGGTVKNLFYTLDEANSKLIAHSSFIGVPVTKSMEVHLYDILDSDTTSKLSGTLYTDFTCMRPFCQNSGYTLEDFCQQCSLATPGVWDPATDIRLAANNFSTLTYDGKSVVGIEVPPSLDNYTAIYLYYKDDSGKIIEVSGVIADVNWGTSHRYTIFLS